MTADVFGEYGRYYDLLYRDKDYLAEADYVADTLRRIDPRVRSILEFGSGTGRHGRLLAERGFEVIGIERSSSMVAQAQRAEMARNGGAGGSFACEQGDIRTVNLGRQFDAVMSLFHVVCYQTENDQLLATCANAARHLRPGGLFLFDVWHGPAVLSERPSVRVKTVEDETTSLSRRAEPTIDTSTGVVSIRYTMRAESKANGQVTTFEEEHRMRYLFPTEIDLLARHAGFAVVCAEELVTRDVPSERTWGVAFVLQKQP